MIKLYGIPNCDTVKKARKWLDAKGVDYQFHDFKKQGIDLDQVKAWLKVVPMEQLVNKRGTTWRKLSDVDKQRAERDIEEMIGVMVESPSLIKRPVCEYDEGQVMVGFDEVCYVAAVG